MADERRTAKNGENEKYRDFVAALAKRSRAKYNLAIYFS